MPSGGEAHDLVRQRKRQRERSGLLGGGARAGRLPGSGGGELGGQDLGERLLLWLAELAGQAA